MKYHVMKMTNPEEYISQALGYVRFIDREIFPGYRNPVWKLHSVVPMGVDNKKGQPLFLVIQYTEDLYLSEEEVQKHIDDEEAKKHLCASKSNTPNL